MATIMDVIVISVKHRETTVIWSILFLGNGLFFLVGTLALCVFCANLKVYFLLKRVCWIVFA